MSIGRRELIVSLPALWGMGTVSLTTCGLGASSVNVAHFGALGNGTTDETDLLTKVHDLALPVFYPRTDAFYKISKTIPLKSNVTSNGATIRLNQDGSGTKSIFSIFNNALAIHASGLILDGGYAGGARNEHSHGFDLMGATNVTIDGNTIRNMYGDCVCIGSWQRKKNSSQIKILNNKLLNPRRCGIAVVSGEDILIQKNKLHVTVGYVATIDLEPDVNGFDFVRDVRILDNEYDTPKYFISAGVNTGTPNSLTQIRGNRGQAGVFFRTIESALFRNALIAGNAFIAKDYTGNMFRLAGVVATKLTGNRDFSLCSPGYQSMVSLNCDLRLENNEFCEAYSGGPAPVQ